MARRTRARYRPGTSDARASSCSGVTVKVGRSHGGAVSSLMPRTGDREIRSASTAALSTARSTPTFVRTVAGATLAARTSTPTVRQGASSLRETGVRALAESARDDVFVPGLGCRPLRWVARQPLGCPRSEGDLAGPGVEVGAARKVGLDGGEEAAGVTFPTSTVTIPRLFAG